jgi:hypothetical protein
MSKNKIFLNVCRKINFLEKKFFFEKNSIKNLISVEASKVLL